LDCGDIRQENGVFVGLCAYVGVILQNSGCQKTADLYVLPRQERVILRGNFMKLEDRIREVMRFKQLGIRTEDAYVRWYRQFVRFHGMRHPDEMGAEEVEAFLTYLAVERNVVAATQNQALNALVFLFREVLGKGFEGVDAMRAKVSKKLPVVLSQDETRMVLHVMTGEEALMAKLLYGCGLRVMECMRLRVKEVDLSGGKLEVRGGKGDKDRVLTIPKSLMAQLEAQLQRCRVIHDGDRENKVAGVYLPGAYGVKNGSAAESWAWFWLFPSARLSADPRADGLVRRHHAHEARVGRALSAAVKAAGLAKKVTAHTMRHSFATHLALRGVDVRSVQELLGHTDIRTTMIYLQLARAMRGEIGSPLDDL
jgi:integron integrase